MRFSPASLVIWRRRLLWALGALVLLWVITWLAVPPLVKSQIEEKGSAALGRKLTVGAIAFRPWSLELTVTDLAIATADGAGTQLGIGRIYIDAEMQSLLRLAPVLDAIHVEAPRLQLTHLGGGHYDIDDVLARLRTPNDASPSDPVKFALYNLELKDGSVDFTDQVGTTQRKHTLRSLNLALPFLSNLPSKRDIVVAPRLAFELNGSAFDSAAAGTVFTATRKGEATLQVTQLDLAPYLPYLPAGLPVQVRGAVIDAKLQLGFEQAEQAQLRLSGAIKVSGLKLADAAGGELLSVAAIQTELADVRPLEGVVKLASLEITQPQLQLARNRAGRLNLDAGTSKKSENAPKNIAGSAQPERATAQSIAFSLDKFALRQGSVRWRDDSTRPQAQMALNDLELQAQGVQWPMKDATRFDASVLAVTGGKTARLALQGEGTDQQGKAHATLNDLALAMAAPYAAQWLNVGLQGVADTELDATWQDGKVLLAVPKLTVRDFALQGGKTNKEQGKEQAAPGTRAQRAASELPRFKLLEITQAQADLQGKTVTVGKVALHNPSAMLHRDAQGRWMVEDWLKPSTAPASEPSKPKAAIPWKLALGELTLDDGTLALDDRSVGRPVRLEVSKLHVQMKSITLDGKKPAPLTVSARIKAGRTEPGSLRYKGTVMWDPVAAQGTLDVRDLPAHAVMPYLADRLNIEVLRADTSFRGQIQYAARPAGPEVLVRGDATLEDFRANSVAAAQSGSSELSVAEELLSWKSLNVPGIDLAITPGAATRVQVREAALTDFYARLLVNPQGRLNLQDLVKTEPAAPTNLAVASAASAPVPAVSAASASGPAPIVKMGPISLVNGKVYFSDRFIQPNYSADLSELTGRLSQFSSQTTDGAVQLADLDIRGRAEGTAALEITGKVNPLAKPLALDIKGRVRDLELPPLSPYAIKYAGYGITRGKLSVDVQYTVLPNGQLTASNQIVLNQLSFGDKVEGAPNSLPVKLAVALLADRNGVIDLNLPISGSLNDPQFSIGPVIWKVITNLVVKAITSPFSLLANALGGGGGESLSSVEFAAGSSVLTPAAQQGLDKVVQALLDRPTLQMTVQGTASLEAERDALKRERLKTLVLAEKRRRAVVTGQDASAVKTVSDAEYPVLLKEVYRRADITKPRNLVGLTKDLPAPEMEALLLASISVNEDAMRELALQRGVAVKDYLASRELPAERLFLGAAKTVAPAADWKPRAELQLTNR
ncbi:hypothetical protein RS694_16490 [Rhodoferax saidenbachensis]|uniref:DUF748 domain-containing protein n=1 Tax=Rhodoferax saidenbachensis TaxID=1484693 RepID=A0A1P8KD55_9BURK|nr:hypothetical protein RS694_16490 [Rhodoferax saidenbachensis]